MKLGLIFEFLFRNQHNDSEFAHFCLLLLLGYLFYTFFYGVKDSLKNEYEYTIRYKREILKVMGVSDEYLPSKQQT